MRISFNDVLWPSIITATLTAGFGVVGYREKHQLVTNPDLNRMIRDGTLETEAFAQATVCMAMFFPFCLFVGIGGYALVRTLIRMFKERNIASGG